MILAFGVLVVDVMSALLSRLSQAWSQTQSEPQSLPQSRPQRAHVDVHASTFLWSHERRLWSHGRCLSSHGCYPQQLRPSGYSAGYPNVAS